MGKIQQIRYNEETDRIEFDGYGIHCGDCLEVILIDDTGAPYWQAVSFEAHGTGGLNNFYMPGHKGINPIGLYARK
jgi:hypothetical protein